MSLTQQMRKTITATMSAALMTIIMGCGRQTVYNAELLRAEKMAPRQPYETLAMLQEREGALCRNGGDSALYELVYSETLRNQGLQIANDSLIARCVEHFGRQGDNERLARALLQQALCMYGDKKYIGAVRKMKESETLAGISGNPDLENRLYESLGMVNGMAGNNDMMMRYYNMSLAAAQHMKDPDRMARILNRMATEYMETGKKDSFVSCVNRCRDLLDKVEPTNKAAIKANIGYLHLHRKDTVKAKEYLHEAYQTCPDRKSSLSLGDIYAAEGNKNMSSFLWYDATNSDNPHIRKAALKRLIGLANEKGDSRGALYLNVLLNNTYENDISTTMATAIADEQTRFDKERTRRDNDARMLWMCAILGTLAAGTVAFTIYHRHRVRKFGSMISSQNKALHKLNIRYMEDIEKYRKAENELEQLKKSQEQYSGLIEEKTREIENIQSQLAEYQNDTMRPERWNIEDGMLNDDRVYSMHRLAASGRCAAKTDWDAMHELINQHDQRLAAIFEKHKNLSPGEVNIIMLTRLRFIPSEIASLTGLSSQNVTNTRSRMLRKMFGMKGGAKDFDEMIRNA